MMQIPLVMLACGVQVVGCSMVVTNIQLEVKAEDSQVKG
jgi:hypothetical protein